MSATSRRECLSLLFGSAAGLAAGASGLLPLLREAYAGESVHYAIGSFADLQGRPCARKYLNACTDRLFLAYCDLKSGTTEKIPVSFAGHVAVKHPSRPWTVILIGKGHGKSAEINLKDKSVTPIQAASDMMFWGHGAFSADGQHFYTSEINRKTTAGSIQVRDAKTYQVIGAFESHGYHPHEFVFIDQGKTAIIANDGHYKVHGNSPVEMKTCVTYVDVKSGKLLAKLKAPEGSDIGYTLGHLMHTKDARLFVGSSPRLRDGEVLYGDVFSGSIKEVLEPLPIPAEIRSRLVDQCLSLAIDETSGILAATQVASNCTLFWSYKENRFIKQIPGDRPSGIIKSPDGRHFVISTKSGALQWVRLANLEVDLSQQGRFITSNTAHLANLEFT